jgi:4-amino-4-deoxy-L-arabinose transferase-like glycosyltransferase
MRRYFDILFIAVCTGLVVFIGAVERPLTRSSEGRVARVAQEMLDDGDWIVPHLNGVVRLEKPPASSWLVALTTKLTGDTEVRAWHAYVPTGVAAIFLTLLVYNWLSPRPPPGNAAEKNFASRGMLAAIVLVTAPGFFLLARSAQMDMVLALLVAVMFKGYYDYRLSHRASSLLLIYAAAGLSILLKGHVGIVIVLPALLAWSVLERTRQALTLAPKGMLRWHLLGVLLVIAIVLPWLIPFLQQSGMSWATFNKEGLGGRVGSDAPHREVWYWYFREMPAWFLPWTLLLLLGLFQKRNLPPDERSPLRRLCWVWLGWGMLLFTALSSKDQHYALPLFAPLAILIADTAARWLEHFEAARATSARRTLVVFSILFATFAIALPLLAARGNYLLEADKTAVWSVSAIAAMVFAFGAVKLAYCQNCFYLWWAGFVCLTMVYSQTMEKNKDALGSPQKFCVEVRSKVPAGSEIYDYDVTLPIPEDPKKKPVWRAQVLFYLRRKVVIPDVDLPTLLKQKPGAYAITTQKNLDEVPAGAYKVLAEQRAFTGREKINVFLIRGK